MPPTGGYFIPMFEYEIIENEDSILIMSNTDSFGDFTIELHKFWNWVVSRELNAFCIDYYDPSEQDRHGQASGYLKKWEYLDSCYQTVKKHLTEYLKNQNKI
jgi:hypothetical protein